MYMIPDILLDAGSQDTDIRFFDLFTRRLHILKDGS